MARKRQSAKTRRGKPHDGQRPVFFRAPVDLIQEVRQHSREKEQAFAVVMRRFMRNGLATERGEARV